MGRESPGGEEHPAEVLAWLEGVPEIVAQGFGGPPRLDTVEHLGEGHGVATDAPMPGRWIRHGA